MKTSLALLLASAAFALADTTNTVWQVSRQRIVLEVVTSNQVQRISVPVVRAGRTNWAYFDTVLQSITSTNHVAGRGPR